MKNELYLQEFDSYLKNEKHSSDNTRQSYLRDLRQFSESHGESLLSVKAEHLHAYISDLKGLGRSPSTVARNVASLKSFYSYCCSKDYLTESPAKELSAEKSVQKVPEILDSREVELLLDQPHCTDLKGYRDKAMLELLYATGIRVSELISLKMSDVDLQNGTITCGDRRTRTISISATALKALTEYISFIRKQMLRDLNEDVLFVNVNGDPMTRQGFWKILKGYQQKAGIQKNITPHMLRHSFAAHLLENGMDMKSVRKTMGHSELSAMGIYAEFAREKNNHKRNI